MNTETQTTSVPTALLQQTLDYLGTCPSRDSAELWISWKTLFSYGAASNNKEVSSE